MKKIIAFWIACSFITFGAVNQELKIFYVCEVPVLQKSQRDKIGLIGLETLLGPYGLIASAYFTNLWQHGFSYKSWDSKDYACVDGEAVYNSALSARGK